MILETLLRRAVPALLLCAGTAAAIAAPCGTASVAGYLGAPACEIGAFTFSGFAVEPFPGATTDIAADGVVLAPIGNGLRLDSGSPLAAAAGELLGLRLLFRVEGPLAGGTVTLDPSAAATGDGVVTALLLAGAAGSATAFVVEGLAEPAASFASGPSTFFDVEYELGVDGGTFGSATLGPGLGEIVFAPIPEPGSVALLGAGLALLPHLRRARRR